MLRRIPSLLVIALLTACSGLGRPNATPSTTELEAEQEAVYAALLKTMYPAEMYVIMDTAQVSIESDALEETLQLVLPQMPGVDPETVDSFTERNERSYTLQTDLELGAPYSLFSLADMRELFGENQNGWEMFYLRYPQAPGIISLSRVGFNPVLDQALVYIGIQSDWQAGAGYYVLLVKVGETWEINQQVMTWIS